MAVENETPMLLQFMFGESAALVHKGTSARLLRWCQAMDDWLAERKLKNHNSTYKISIYAWKRLLSWCAKTPWEITAADVQAHIERLQAQGFAPSTINTELGHLSSFYQWCEQQGVDPACEEGFNPPANVPRLDFKRYANAKLLSRCKVDALLSILQRDESNLGRRDYAFFLARLHLGVKLKPLQQLQWGQFEQDEDGVWLRWEADQERAACPPEVWQAVCVYLHASGRMPGIRPQDYIFAPMKDVAKREASGQLQEWDPGRCLSDLNIMNSLRKYGRLAGIPDEDLTLRDLRHTAVRLRQQAGDSLEKIHAFLGTKAALNETRRYLRLLPPLPPDGEPSVGEAEPPPLPKRKPRIIGPGEGITHGFYAQKQPAEEVQAMLAEDIQGIDDEIVGLRTLHRELLKRQNRTENSEELAQLYSASTQTADRLRQMVNAAEQLAETNEEDELVEQLLAMLDNVAIEMGEGPISEEVRQEALGSDPEMAAASRRLTEEIASTRLVLRRAFSLAKKAKSVREQVRYTEIYSSGCIRLVRLLKAEGAAQGRLLDFLGKEIDAVIQEVNEEFGLEIGGGRELEI